MKFKINWFVMGMLLAFFLSGCSSSPKILMKNCTKIHDDYYECEDVPKKNLRKPRGRF